MRSIAKTDSRTNGDYPFDMFRWRIWKSPLRCGQCRLAKLSLGYLVGRFRSASDHSGYCLLAHAAPSVGAGIVWHAIMMCCSPQGRNIWAKKRAEVDEQA